MSFEYVAEAAVIGQADEDTGQSICAFVTLQGEDDGDERLEGQISDHVATRIGRFARPKRMIWAHDLPKTRSGKIMRRLLRDIAEGRELGDVTTLRDPDVMQRLEQLVKERQDQEDGGEPARAAGGGTGRGGRRTTRRPRAVRERSAPYPVSSSGSPKRANASGSRNAMISAIRSPSSVTTLIACATNAPRSSRHS